MIRFAWPWIFALLPLPWLLRALLPPRPPAAEAALRVPFLEEFAPPSGTTGRSLSRRWPLWLAACAWLLLVTAAARPQWQGPPRGVPVSGRDLMLAVDLSGSMATRDFVLDGHRVDRLTAIKAVAGNFIRHRRGDRLGLILFGTQAYLQTPLTFDHKTLRTLLDQAAIGLAGKQTAIGDAIGLAVKRLRRVPARSRVLILLTDGANDAGVLSPTKAAQIAAQAGLKIYTIGIGADSMEVPTLFGTTRVNPSSGLDAATLKKIAATTGGRYFRARGTASLKKIYALLDRLEPVAGKDLTLRPTKALFPWPLGLALLLGVATAGLTYRQRC